MYFSRTCVRKWPTAVPLLLTFFTLLCTFSSAYAALNFDSAANYGTGVNPKAVITGDFNSDGMIDIVVANSGGATVSVLLGNGDGVFVPASNFAAGNGPFSVAAGDFNGDGSLDMATANCYGNNISVMMGNGDGTFQAAKNISAGYCPSAIVAGDFNGDGKPDLAVANDFSNSASLYNTISIYLWDGTNKTFKKNADYAAGNGPAYIATGDFNGDGKTDLAVADYGSGSVSVFMGNGNGAFAAAVSYGAGFGPGSIAVGDFNGDGKKDLAVADYWSPDGNNVSVLIGNGDGTFAPAAAYGPTGQGPGPIVSGDFNGDGKLDVITANYDDNSVSVLLGNGDGTFTGSANYIAGSGPSGITPADFNGDGKLDIVTANYDSNSVSALFGNGDGTFSVSVNYRADSSPISVASADFNGDGKRDMAIANYVGNDVSVLLGNGDGTFASAVNYIVGTNSSNPVSPANPAAVVAGDFNGDGKTDLAVADYRSSDGYNVSVFIGNGDGTFGSAVNYAAGSGPGSITCGDFNGDGKPDLAVANGLGDNVSVLIGNGDGAFGSAVDYPAGKNPASVVAGDFDGDGRPDLAVADYYGAGISILRGNGDGTFGAAVLYNAGDGPMSITAADFDGDGKLDLAAANYWTAADYTVSVLPGNGDGTFSSPRSFVAGADPRSITSDDFNGDGKPDIATADYDSSDASVIINSTDNNSIIVTVPNGGDTWKAGTTYTIIWTYTGNPGANVRIELYNGTAFDRVIVWKTAKGTGGIGSYDWTVPSTQARGSAYKVKVRSASRSMYGDMSDGTFTIAPRITVTAPNGGENWTAGAVQEIKWSYAGNPGAYVKIELYKGGALNRTISWKTSKGSGESGSYMWAIPAGQEPGGDYRIEVKSNLNNTYFDKSDADFSISR